MKNKKIKVGVLFIFIMSFIFLGAAGCVREDICTQKGMIKQGDKCVPPPTITLNIWGLYDDSSAFSESIQGFESIYNSQHTNNKLSIRYNKQVYNKETGDYEKRLTDTFAAGNAPDIFMINNKWLGRYLKKNLVKESPATIFDAANYRQAFVDVANDDFVVKGNVYAVPLYIDTLALFYNADILKNAGIIDSFGFVKPPADWTEFKDDVEKITIIDKENLSIKRAGAILGTSANINRGTDIFTTLVFQSGGRMTDEDNNEVVFNKPQSKLDNVSVGEVALRFYTDFADPAKRVYTWNQEMDYSIDAFYQGKAAMMINYAYVIPSIKSKNEKLNFGIAKIPQLRDSENKAAMANYWGFVVSSRSDKTDLAWSFLNYFSQKENMAKYLGKTGRPTPRRDMVEEQKNDPILGPFVEQVFYAKNWYQGDDVAVESILGEMIDSVASKEKTINTALSKAAEEVNYVIWKSK